MDGLTIRFDATANLQPGPVPGNKHTVRCVWSPALFLMLAGEERQKKEHITYHLSLEKEGTTGTKKKKRVIPLEPSSELL